MVCRQLKSQILLTASLAGLVIGLLCFAGSSEAANRRIAISEFAWSDSSPTIDLGEKVTWYWTGPDVLHSVTGLGSAASGIDSDLSRTTPFHSVGDTFTWTFDTPGTYQFFCKFHGALPGGTVTVTSTPGDPNTDSDPVPPNKGDTTAPRIGMISLEPSSFPARAGSQLTLGLDEHSIVDAEIWRLKGRRLGRYAGWREWRAILGLNFLNFGKKSARFKAKPGRYRAMIYAIDDFGNESDPKYLDFTIR